MLRILEYDSNLGTEILQILILLIDILTIIDNASIRCLKKTIQVLYQGRFTRTGMADNANELTIFDGQAYIIESLKLICSSCTVFIRYMVENQ